MNRPSLFGAVAVATALAMAPVAIAQSAWSTYSNAEYHLTVETPAPPAIKTVVIKRADGEVPALQGVFVSDGNVAMMFSVNDMSKLTLGANPEAALDDAAAGAGRNRVIDKQSSVTIHGAHGRVIEAHNDKATFHVRLFFVGHRLYMALSAAPPGTATPDFDRFADSLRAT
jgi:hypothetical protein